MLGVIGFSCAAIVIAIFALTSYQAFLTVDQNKRWAFSLAFLLLAVDMAIWALCCVIPAVGVARFMLLSDVILLTATGFIGSVMVGKYMTPYAVMYPFLAGVLLVKRMFEYEPEARVQDGLLYFNLQPDAKSVIIGLLLFVWLPAVSYLAFKGMRHQMLLQLRNGVVGLFATMIFATAILVSARRSAVLVLSFIGIVGLFATAGVVNVAVARIYKQEGSGHGTEQSRK